jgi:membrane protease YdiL (CAAX protease family)
VSHAYFLAKPPNNCTAQYPVGLDQSVFMNKGNKSAEHPLHRMGGIRGKFCSSTRPPVNLAFGAREVERPLTATGFAGREVPESARLAALGLVGSAALFGAGALLLLLTTQVAVPALVSATGTETVVAWFLAASTVLFGPLLLIAALLLYRERRTGRLGSWGVRLWLRPMNGGDWLWAIGGFATIGVLTGGIGVVLGMLSGDTKLHPSFMAFEPLGPGRYWILGAWLPFFVLNIVGEEFVWRAVVLPRQEVAFGRRAWLVNGLLWLLFHAAFPWQVLVTLVPITLILPYVVQRQRNTWIGVVIHAAFGAMGFLALAFGLA